MYPVYLKFLGSVHKAFQAQDTGRPGLLHRHRLLQRPQPQRQRPAIGPHELPRRATDQDW